MRIESVALLAEPMLAFGIVALSVILILLALFRNWWRVLAGLVGAATGYVLLGTELAYRFAESARASHQCPDAAWLGPAIGELPGAVVALILFEAIQSTRPKRKDNRGSGGSIAAG